MGGELWAAVSSDGLGQSIEIEYPLDDEVGEVLGVCCGGAWYQVSLLGQVVDHNPNGVIIVGP